MMNWKKCPPIPPRPGMAAQFGMAGPVAGADGNFMLVAGGANFEDGMPWRGGAKSYHDDIYLLEAEPGGSYSWKACRQKLPVNLAYSASVSMKNGIVSIGGENADGPLGLVLKLTFADGKVNIESLPDLPVRITSAGCTRIGEKIYVVGGIGKDGASSGFYKLELAALAEGWEKLPDLPVRLSHSVVVAQGDGHEQAIYVFGGRNKRSETTTFFSDVFKFTFSSGRWSREGDIAPEGKPLPVAAGTGFALGDDQIILLGGDRGFFFNQTERMNLEIESEKSLPRKDTLLARKDYFLSHHPGFSGEILSYNTITRKWSHIGEMPGEAPVTTVAFPWMDHIIIPSGEIRPGVRTGQVLMLENAR